MNIPTRRSCGHQEAVTFKGSPSAWKEREELLKRAPCNKCHIQQLQDRVKAAVPTLTELCLGPK